MYEVHLGQFSGPLDKLLELIEAKHLEITEVNLAAVTADFLNYLKSIEGEIEPHILADFLSVASKLVLIKSKTLLPDLELTGEEQESIHDLEARLEIYKHFTARIKEEQTASFYIKQTWEAREISHSRQLFMSLKSASFFYPASNLKPENLKKSLDNLVSALEAFFPKTGKIRQAIISLEAKVKELLSRLKEAAEHSFLNLSEKKSRQEVVVTFLALLHLFRDRTIHLEQKKQFGDIMIKKIR